MSLDASVAGYLAAPPWGLRYVCLGSPVRVSEFVMCACEFFFFSAAGGVMHACEF